MFGKYQDSSCTEIAHQNGDLLFDSLSSPSLFNTEQGQLLLFMTPAIILATIS